MYLLACQVVRQQLRARVVTSAPVMVDMPASAGGTTHARYERSGIDATHTRTGSPVPQPAQRLVIKPGLAGPQPGPGPELF
ncbi:hypothetical protein G6F59_018784 [Rhizopus arrhizus]|nr:hypothetical protein G6F59_018784 [Rhizopus arrhizus]